jgi:hypothetical protein
MAAVLFTDLVGSTPRAGDSLKQGIRRFPQLRLGVSPEDLRWRHGLGVQGLCELPVVPGR